MSVQSFSPPTTDGQTTILVETLLNEGAGNFPTQKTLSYTAPVPSTLETNPIATLADVNQDGKLDLLLVRDAVGGSPLYVDVLLGNGDGSFQPPGAAGTISFAGSMAVYNSSYLLTANLVAGSSIPDIVLGNFYGIYIAKGNGDGTFQTATQILKDYILPSFQIADLNGDGRLDLALNGTAGVTTFLGNGDGTFGGIAGAVVSGYDENGVQQITLADFNGDGKIDLAAQNDFNGDVELAPGNGDGTFRATPVLFSSTTPVLNPQDLNLQVAGDITGNGNDQVIGFSNGTVLSGSPNGNGGFNYLHALPTVANETFFLYPVLGDFNGDGKQDLILSGQSDNNVAVALSNGDGTFATPVNVPFSVAPKCGAPINVAVGDVNGDGKLDLLMAYAGDFQCGIPNTVPSGYLVALGNGDGSFKTATFTPSGESLYTLALAPYHGPGKPLDMVVSDEGLPPGTHRS